MAKYHINAKGVPAICRAEKGRCPFGGDGDHYDTPEQAQEAADKQNAADHGALAGITKGSFEDRDYSVAELRNGGVDLFKNAESIERDLSGRYGDVSLDDYDKNRGLSLDLENMKIEINNFDELNDKQRTNLAMMTRYTTSRKTGNALGFVNSDSKTSISNTKERDTSGFVGSYDDFVNGPGLLYDTGWSKRSSQAQSSETTAFNKLVDKKGFDITSDILKKSRVNQESSDFPSTGLAASVQALRLKGWKEEEIKNVAMEYRLDKVVYDEYGVKPRENSGASEISRVIHNDLESPWPEKEKELADKLGWEEVN